MGRLSDEWKYDELRPRPAKDREKAAKRIASMPYEEAVKEMEKLHSEFNINDHNDISRRVMEKTKGNPDNYGKKIDNEVVNDKSVDAIKDNFTPPDAEDENIGKRFKTKLGNGYSVEEEISPTDYRVKYDDGKFDMLSKDLHNKNIANGFAEELIDTNDNGKIEVDEMADFQKSLDDYSAKNKKGRDDIPVTTRR